MTHPAPLVRRSRRALATAAFACACLAALSPIAHPTLGFAAPPTPPISA